MYWLGYGIVFTAFTTYAFFVKMTPQDRADFLKKIGM